MRILHLDTGREMRGGQHQVLILRETLARLGCEQTLLAGPAIRSKHRFEAASWSSIRRHARRCDLIHAHDARAHTLALIHGRGKPLVVARRVAFPLGRGPASAWKYRGASHFIAISAHVASVLKAGGVASERISVVYDAAPDEAVLAAPGSGAAEHDAASRSGFRIVTPNFHDPLKGRELALQACRLADVPVLISDDLTSDLRSAEALLYISRSEGLGSAILLAMLAGLPTIASDVGGIKEVVEHGSTGLLVANDANSIAEAIRKLRDDSSLRASMARAARLRVRSKFNRDQMAERTQAIYRSVLAASPMPSAEVNP